MSRPVGVCALLLCLFAVTAAAQAVDRPRAAAPARTPGPSLSGEDQALLRQLADAQRNLGEELQELKERIEGFHNELANQADRDNAILQEIKAARDEIKGLYVESSTLKQQIDSVKDDVAGVNSNVSAFRTFSGFFIAVMILLLAVIFVLSIRR